MFMGSKKSRLLIYAPTREFQMHCTKRKESHSKDYILHFVYMTFWKMFNYRDRKQISGLLMFWGGSWGWRKESISKGIWGDEGTDSDLECHDGYTTLCSCQNQQDYTIKSFSF